MSIAATNEAARKINQILAELEKMTGSTIKRIDLARTETTGVDSDGRQFSAGVVIELFRAPGHDWAT